MKKLLFVGLICICVFTSMIAVNDPKSSLTSINSIHNNPSNFLTGTDNSPEVSYWIDSMYSNMNLANAGLSKTAFFNACKGYEYLLSKNEIKKPGILTVCDYSQCSNKKRLYILNLNTGKILYNTYVSHGRNSGNNYATSFSNDADSYKTCLGFMITAETYMGDNGYSLRLDGIEKNFNDNVRNRAIVMHGSDYVCRDRAVNGTMMGRSFGCPAVPAAEVKKIVELIKGGSCLFSFYPDKNYAQNSKILNASFVWPVSQLLQIASVKIPDSLKNLNLTYSLN